ncbi:MAG: hypothetical protein NXI04_03390 [Planctomycetaceae bacterium]|nr:hypothetical protein [Planctomycetaceae bacterium]
MKLTRKIRKQIYEALPAAFIKKAEFVDGAVTPEGKSHEDRAEWWAKQGDAYLLFALDPEGKELPRKCIRKLAEILKVKLDPDGDPYDHQADVWFKATGNVTPEDHQAVVALMYSDEEASSSEIISDEQLWELADQKACEVLHLKTRRSKSCLSTPVATWNSRLSSRQKEGVWLKIDMRLHPNSRLSADGVLVVTFLHEEKSTAKFHRNQVLKTESGEKLLYGQPDWDYPELEVLKQIARKKDREAMDESPDACDVYESQWWAEAKPDVILAGATVYAQLGGFPISWSEESSGEQLRKHLIARTYRDSEPWLEVFKVGRGYTVTERIS